MQAPNAGQAGIRYASANTGLSQQQLECTFEIIHKRLRGGGGFCGGVDFILAGLTLVGAAGGVDLSALECAQPVQTRTTRSVGKTRRMDGVNGAGGGTSSREPLY